MAEQRRRARQLWEGEIVALDGQVLHDDDNGIVIVALADDVGVQVQRARLIPLGDIYKTRTAASDLRYLVHAVDEFLTVDGAAQSAAQAGEDPAPYFHAVHEKRQAMASLVKTIVERWR